MKAQLFFPFLLLFSAINLANPQTNSNQAVTPDVYELSGGDLHVNYATTSMTGQPYFSYQDGNHKLSFKGKEIQQEKSEIGTLVTVRIRMTVDSGSTTFTLLLPTVRLANSSHTAQIHAIGITTEHRFSVIPAMNLGQKETYKTTELSGTAKLVLF
ncbi:MAG TPA: hypothetical protein VJA94_08680 [Candidatus Angelobacter sp.]